MNKLEDGTRVEVVDEVVARSTGADVRHGNMGTVKHDYVCYTPNYPDVVMDSNNCRWSIPIKALRVIS